MFQPSLEIDTKSEKVTTEQQQAHKHQLLEYIIEFKVGSMIHFTVKGSPWPL